MVTLNSLQLYIYKRAFFENFTLSVKGKIKRRTFIIKKKRERREIYIEQKYFRHAAFLFRLSQEY